METLSNYERVAAYVVDHPGCTVTQVERGVHLRDAGSTWGYLIDAERAGLIRSEHPPGEPWRFYGVES